MSMHRYTVAQYHRMIEVGVLGVEDRVELLEGFVVDKMPQNPSHAGTISIVHEQLGTRLQTGWTIRIQSPITAGGSEPEPDLAVVQGPAQRYLTAHPRAENIGMLIEISDTTILHDRTQKGRVYAKARIPIYWIVNLTELHVEVHTNPRGGKSPGYRLRRVFALDAKIDVILNGRSFGEISVISFFPSELKG